MPIVARAARVVDLGSNSVRLVVYEGHCRNPVAIFNEKAVLRLGRGLQSDRAAERGGHGAGADRAAPLPRGGARDGRRSVRGAGDRRGARRAQRPRFRRRVCGRACRACRSASCPGVQEARAFGRRRAVRHSRARTASWPISAAARWNWCGWTAGTRGASQTLRLGVDPAGGASRRRSGRARGRSPRRDLATVPWLAEGAGRDLYLVGGAWRALARIHMAQTGYPLQHGAPLHHRPRGGARPGRRDRRRRPRERWSSWPGVSRRRVDDLPFAAVVLRRLLRATGARRVVFSANGLREGWFMRRMPEAIRAAGSAARRRPGTGGAVRPRPDLPPALLGLDRRRCFPSETRRGAAAARGGVLDVGHRQPRPSGIPRRAGVPARAAPARDRAGPPRARFPRAGHRAALRGGRRRAFLRPARLLLDAVERATRGGAGDGAAAGLHAVGRHAGSAGGHRAALSGRRLVLRLRRTPACSPARA